MDCEELKAGQQILQAQNSDLKEEITTLKTQINQPSWASIAAIGAGEHPPNPTPPPPSKPKNRDQKDALLCIRISTVITPTPSDKTEDSLTRYLPAEEVKNRVVKALRKNKPTEAAEIDEALKEAANKNSEWLRDLGDQTKVVRPQFGIVVHRTPTREINLTDDKARSITKITEENELTDKGFKIVNIAWLKRRDSDLRVSALLGI
ncbi:hypothetical protein BDBG_17906 [Blastomyces gilchristii SLH14081]|uniref:Uncharacterized protein n=1 Tax=Blastomyces gilchristii (strain SLH14081) TaxID=559298 RepID=A0A179V0X6_BLAGS|nr:uncharacterized protein BDBG_17906 [Blastomyces gilchristii SLH14081]OAT13730.1 hypothetical protein BDBG_17906 [Blastomyces gilchristii SLH14081]